MHSVVILTQPKSEVAFAIEQSLQTCLDQCVLSACLNLRRDRLLERLRESTATATLAIIVDQDSDIRRNLLIGQFLADECACIPLMLDRRDYPAGFENQLVLKLDWPFDIHEMIGLCVDAKADFQQDPVNGRLTELFLCVNWHDLKAMLWSDINSDGARRLFELMESYSHESAVAQILDELASRLLRFGEQLLADRQVGTLSETYASYNDWLKRNGRLWAVLKEFDDVLKG